MEETLNICNPNAGGTFTLDTINQDQINALFEYSACKFEVTYGKCKSDKSRVFKGCVLTDIIEPHYTILERFIKWIGSELHIESLCLFHEKHTSYEFSVESVEYL